MHIILDFSPVPVLGRLVSWLGGAQQATGAFVLATLLTAAASPLAQGEENGSPKRTALPVWSPERPASSWKIPSVRVSTSADTNRSVPRVRISSLQETGSNRSETAANSANDSKAAPRPSKQPNLGAKATVTPGTVLYDEGNWPLAVSADDAIVYDEFAGSVPFSTSDQPRRERVWIRGEYLLWCTQEWDVPALVTTSSAGTPIANAGVLGLPTTGLLFGDDSVGGDIQSGLKLTAGTWLGADRSQGIEASVLTLAESSGQFGRFSTDTPILARPYFDEPSASQAALVVAYPGVISGSVGVEASSEFKTFELLWRGHLMPPANCGPQLDLLLGYRYARLDEGLRIDQFSEWTARQGVIVTGTTKSLFDTFETENQFNGVQLGISLEQNWGAWSVEGLMKLALGYNQSNVFIDGSTTTTVPGGGSANFAGGLLAQTTNMGSHDQSDFAVIPELGITLTRQLTTCLQANVGYSFLYWSQVAHPGDQVDLNLSQLPPEAPQGSRSPEFQFTSNDFWAQGLRLGLDFRY